MTTKIHKMTTPEDRGGVADDNDLYGPEDGIALMIYSFIFVTLQVKL